MCIAIGGAGGFEVMRPATHACHTQNAGGIRGGQARWCAVQGGPLASRTHGADEERRSDSAKGVPCARVPTPAIAAAAVRRPRSRPRRCPRAWAAEAHPRKRSWSSGVSRLESTASHSMALRTTKGATSCASSYAASAASQRVLVSCVGAAANVSRRTATCGCSEGPIVEVASRLEI